MKSPRLTKHDRERAVRALIAAIFKEREAQARASARAIAREALALVFGPEYEKLAALPTGWAHSASMINFAVGGLTRSLAFDVPLPLPHCAPFHVGTFEATDGIGVKIAAHADRLDGIRRERHELAVKALATAESFTTVKALADGWPTIAPYLPPEKTRPPLPAVDIANLDAALDAAKKGSR